MRFALRLALFLSLSSACTTTTPGAPPTSASPVGLSGGPLASAVSVLVRDEATGAPLASATVACGGTSAASAGVVRCEGAGPVDIVVSAPGYVTERWIGVAHAHAVIALAARAGAMETLHGEITGATDRASIGVSSPFGIVRSGDVTLGAQACEDATDCAVALMAPPRASRDVAVLDHGAARLVLVRDVAIDAAGGFAIDVLAQPEIETLVMLEATLPSAEGLVEVVGVPGLSTSRGVSLLGSLADGTSLMAPAREASLAGDRLWFVAHARTTDGSGESFALDRDVPVGDTSVQLPSAFLAVPIASRSADVVTITPGVDATTYIVESSDAAGVTERAFVLARDAVITVPVSGTSVRVRALDAREGDVVDLDAIAAETTRFADRTL